MPTSHATEARHASKRTHTLDIYRNKIHMKIKKEVQIGLLAIVAVALGYIGVNFLKGIEIFKKTSIYYAHFDNLSGISAAAPVEASGFKVGNVRSVAFDYSRGYGATLELALDDDMRIPVGSQLKIKSNPLGSAELVLVINPQSQTYLSEGDTIASQDAGDGLLSSVSEKILPAIAGMMPTITNTLERLNALLNDKSIDSMLYGLNASTQQLHGMMAGLNRTSRSLGPVLDNVGHMSSNLANFSGQLSSMRLDSLMLSLQETTAQLQMVSQQLRGKDNTAGLLLNDPSLYNRLDSLVGSADRLMRDLQENPKRYVHFSIF